MPSSWKQPVRQQAKLRRAGERGQRSPLASASPPCRFRIRNLFGQVAFSRTLFFGGPVRNQTARVRLACPKSLGKSVCAVFHCSYQGCFHAYYDHVYGMRCSHDSKSHYFGSGQSQMPQMRRDQRGRGVSRNRAPSSQESLGSQAGRVNFGPARNEQTTNHPHGKRQLRSPSLLRARAKGVTRRARTVGAAAVMTKTTGRAPASASRKKATRD